MQGRCAVDGGLVDIRVAEHALEAGQIAGLGGFHQRRIGLVSRAVERPAHGNQGSQVARADHSPASRPVLSPTWSKCTLTLSRSDRPAFISGVSMG